MTNLLLCKEHWARALVSIRGIFTPYVQLTRLLAAFCTPDRVNQIKPDQFATTSNNIISFVDLDWPMLPSNLLKAVGYLGIAWLQCDQQITLWQTDSDFCHSDSTLSTSQQNVWPPVSITRRIFLYLLQCLVQLSKAQSSSTVIGNVTTDVETLGVWEHFLTGKSIMQRHYSI
jgi:hypothetical protein